jgi:transposase
MTRFVVGDDRSQSTLFPERLEDYLSKDNPVRAIDVFVDELDLAALGFGGVEPEATGRPAYHPATLLKIYVYGYLNRVQSSRRLERECQRNIELVWLTGRLMPDFKTIADFRKDNGEAIRRVCREFVVLCRRLELFSEASVAIDGSKFKAVNTRDRNFTQAKMQRRLAQIDESIARYLSQLDSADRQGEAVPEAKITRLNEKIAALRHEIQRLNTLNSEMMQTEDKQICHLPAFRRRRCVFSVEANGNIGADDRGSLRAYQPSQECRAHSSGIAWMGADLRRASGRSRNRTRERGRGKDQAGQTES